MTPGCARSPFDRCSVAVVAVFGHFFWLEGSGRGGTMTNVEQLDVGKRKM